MQGVQVFERNVTKSYVRIVYIRIFIIYTLYNGTMRVVFI